MNQLTSSQYCIPFSRYNNARVLAANIAESFVVPSGAYRVAFNINVAGQAFWVDDQKTAVIPTDDVIDGSAPELNPGMRLVQPGQTLSVISAAACIVTASFYTMS